MISMKKVTTLIILSIVLFNGLFAQTYLPPISWTSSAVKDPQQSAGFIDVADFNNDGINEIVLSTLMEEGGAQSPWQAKGAIRIFSMPSSGMNNPWNEVVVLPTSENLPFLNDPQIIDVNEDGFLDIIVNQGFIQTNGGSQQWIEGPNFTQRHDFAPESTHGLTYYFWHEVVQVDLDGDGRKDIVTTSAQTQDAANSNNGSIAPKNAKIEWYRHLGNGNFEYHLINDSLGGVFLKLHDIDSDGDQDIVVSQFWWGVDEPPLVWLENTSTPDVSNNYEGDWNYHVIDNTTGLGYYMEFYDIDIDGVDELVYVNHNNQDNSAIDYGSGVVMPGLFYFEIPANPASSSQWAKTTIYDGFRTNLFDFGNAESQGCPGVFSIGDVDGNGYPDIAVPGDGNDTLYLFRQIPGNTFVKEVLDIGKMFGMTKIKDLNNDGKLEIIAAKHNFPDLFQLFNPPAGFLNIYESTLNCIPPTVAITPEDPVLCPNGSLVIDATTSLYYVWNTLETAQSISVSTIGEYSVITVDNNGCPSVDTVTVLESPTPSILQNVDILSSSISGESYQWYLDGSPIPNSDMQSIVISQNGDYTVEVFYNGCSEVSNPLTISTASIEATNIVQFEIYPNPTTGLIFLKNVLEGEEYSVLNTQGKVILSGTFNANEATLDFTNYSPGIYYLKINSTLKIISKLH